jgi:hypothetical protein
VTEELERRYRGLLEWYPAAYRAEYGEEMLGVLLDGAREGQRYPAPAEAANLIRSALSLRLGRGAPGMADPHWPAASATYGLLGSLLVVAHFAGGRLTSILWEQRVWDQVSVYVSPRAWLAPLAWLLVAVAAAVRWWIVAALSAWAAVFGEGISLGGRYLEWPVSVVHELPLFLFAISIAAALSAAAAQRDRVTIAARPTVTFGVSIVLAGLAPVLDALTYEGGSVWPFGGGFFPGVFSDGPLGAAGLARLIAYLVAAIVALIAFRHTDGRVRRRLLVLLMPAVSVAAMIKLTFNGFMESSVRFNPPVLLEPEQWVALVAVPVTAFLAGLVWLHRRERRLHLIRLGELAERRRPDADATAEGAQSATG